MNYLMHAYFSSVEPGCVAGVCIGDFVKGRIENTHYAPEIKKGLQLHRDLDRFAQDSPIYLRSRERLDKKFRRMSGIILDIAYDHFLAKYWTRYSEQPLADFAKNVYAILKKQKPLLPADFYYFLSTMTRENWLYEYQDIKMIATVLSRMAYHLPFENNLAESITEIERNYKRLAGDVADFILTAKTCFPVNQATNELITIL
jgi:acyl carrier protein phosphodiesterase